MLPHEWETSFACVQHSKRTVKPHPVPFCKPAQHIQISQISFTCKKPSFNLADSRFGTSGAKVALWFLYRVCWQVFDSKTHLLCDSSHVWTLNIFDCSYKLSWSKIFNSWTQWQTPQPSQGSGWFLNDGNEWHTQFLISVSRVQGVAFFCSLKPLIDRNGSNWRSSYRISVLWDFNEVVF